jgi:hypothetical protein
LVAATESIGVKMDQERGPFRVAVIVEGLLVPDDNDLLKSGSQDGVAVGCCGHGKDNGISFFRIDSAFGPTATEADFPYRLFTTL